MTQLPGLRHAALDSDPAGDADREVPGGTGCLATAGLVTALAPR